MPEVQVNITNIAGDQLELILEDDTSVLHVKHEISNKWSVPRVCQKLIWTASPAVLEEEEKRYVDDQLTAHTYDQFVRIFGEFALEEWEQAMAKDPLEECPVSSLCDPATAAASAMLIVDVQKLCQNLVVGNVREKDAAVLAFRRLGQKGVERVIELLDSEDWAVRSAGVKTLASIVDKGCQKIIEILSWCLEDDSWNVRQAAVDALLQVADKGDTHAIREVSYCLEHESCHVRWAAVEV